MNPIFPARPEILLKQAQAGLLAPLIYAPFSAIAAAITGPEGERGKASALGAVLGAGMAALAQKEYAERKARGEQVNTTDFVPLFKAILTGLATGGMSRAIREQQQTGRVGNLAAILAGAPTGALIMSDNPVIGSLVGGVVAPYVARLLSPAARTIPPEVRARAAFLAARARYEGALRALPPAQ